MVQGLSDVTLPAVYVDKLAIFVLAVVGGNVMNEFHDLEYFVDLLRGTKRGLAKNAKMIRLT